VTAIERRDGQPAGKLPVNVSGRISSFDEVYRLAQNLSTAGLMPRDLRGKAADVTAIILYGQDLGLSPMQSIQGIYVVEGRPSLSAQSWLALVRRAGHKPSVLEHSAERCTVHIVRGDDPTQEHTATWSIQDAVNAQRCQLRDGKPYARSKEGKPLPWELYPKAMLLARAVSECCRFIAPEIALGFYTPDEVEEIAERELVDASRVDSPQVTEEPAQPQDVAAAVEAIEAEFVEEPTQPRRGRTVFVGGHEVMLTPSDAIGVDEAWRWICDTCQPGEDDAHPAMSYEDALADHAHFAATAGGEA
jgi:hypothetical protein